MWWDKLYKETNWNGSNYNWKKYLHLNPWPSLKPKFGKAVKNYQNFVKNGEVYYETSQSQDTFISHLNPVHNTNVCLYILSSLKWSVLQWFLDKNVLYIFSYLRCYMSRPAYIS